MEVHLKTSGSIFDTQIAGEVSSDGQLAGDSAQIKQYGRSLESRSCLLRVLGRLEGIAPAEDKVYAAVVASNGKLGR